MYKKETTKTKYTSITEILYMRIRVDSQKIRTGVIQCHRCQSFGHNQLRCQQQPRCVRCGKNQHTQTCINAKNIQTSCANCRGPHLANHRRYRDLPKNTRPENRHRQPNQPQQRQQKPANMREGTSYAKPKHN